MKRLSSILGICMLCLCPFTLCGCGDPYEGYSGKYQYAYTEACYSLIFAEGFIDNLHELRHPIIELIDEDEYGRKLLYYYEYQYYIDEDSEKYILSLLISQKEDEEYVYYYSDVNFLSTLTVFDDYTMDEYTLAGNYSVILDEFDENEINAFKERNDWNKEFSIDKCIRQKIVNKKPSDAVITRPIEENICKDIAGSDHYTLRDIMYLCSDDDGRKLYGIEIYYNEKIWYYVAILDPDFTYNKNTFIKEISLPFNCYDELKELKQNNNWSEALITL